MRSFLASLLLMVVAAPVFAAEKDIVDTAVGAGSFKTLVAAVKAAGLVDVLKGEGPFTVMAPTDEAFAKLPEGTVETLLKPENKDKLIAVLTYHVIPAKAMAADVVKLNGKAGLHHRDDRRQDGHHHRGHRHRDRHRRQIHHHRGHRHRQDDHHHHHRIRHRQRTVS